MNEVTADLNAIEYGDFDAIGLPPGMVDVDALAYRMGLPFKPATSADISTAMAELEAFTSQQKRSPLRRHVAVNRLKGIEKMPAAAPVAKAAPQNQSSAAAPMRQSRPPMITTRQAVAAKSCRTDEDRERLYNVGMEIRARVGLFTKIRDIVAERHCEKVVGFDVRAIANETNPTGGGHLVPTPLSDSVIELRAQAGLARRVGSTVTMTADSLSVPKVNGELTVYYPAETQATTASDLTFGSLFFQAKKRAVLAYASNELTGDALISFADTFMRGAAYSLAAKEDRELIRGDGSSTFNGEVGLLTAIGAGGVVQAAAGHDLLTELDIADWTSAMAKLPERHVDARLSWIMSAAVYFGSALRACGGNAQGFDEFGRPMLLGYPVNFSIDMPTATAANTVIALFGNFEKCVMIGDRIPFAMTMSEHAAFSSDTLTFRAGSRYDLIVTEAGDASNAGAVVALKTAAS